MTQEDKELLLKDLCMRLPYGVIADTPKGKGYVCDINLTIFGTEIGVNINPTVRDTFSINDVKPYLFPLSSMTEEQKQEYTYIMNYISPDDTDNWKEGEFIYVEQFTQLMHFYHINHLDYRGLIPMGLAEDATDKNIY